MFEVANSGEVNLVLFFEPAGEELDNGLAALLDHRFDQLKLFGSPGFGTQEHLGVKFVKCFAPATEVPRIFMLVGVIVVGMELRASLLPAFESRLRLRGVKLQELMAIEEEPGNLDGVAEGGSLSAPVNFINVCLDGFPFSEQSFPRVGFGLFDEAEMGLIEDIELQKASVTERLRYPSGRIGSFAAEREGEFITAGADEQAEEEAGGGEVAAEGGQAEVTKFLP